MHHISNFHSNLVTTLSPNMRLTLKSVPNQNLTCSTTTSHNATSSSSLSSFCSIPFTLGKLKIEMTKKPMYNAGKNGERSGGENLHNSDENGSIPVGRISMETVQRGTLSHTTQGKVLSTQVHLMTSNTQTPFVYPASM